MFVAFLTHIYVPYFK